MEKATMRRTLIISFVVLRKGFGMALCQCYGCVTIMLSVEATTVELLFGEEFLGEGPVEMSPFISVSYNLYQLHTGEGQKIIVRVDII